MAKAEEIMERVQVYKTWQFSCQCGRTYCQDTEKGAIGMAESMAKDGWQTSGEEELICPDCAKGT